MVIRGSKGFITPKFSREHIGRHSVLVANQTRIEHGFREGVSDHEQLVIINRAVLFRNVLEIFMDSGDGVQVLLVADDVALAVQVAGIAVEAALEALAVDLLLDLVDEEFL